MHPGLPGAIASHITSIGFDGPVVYLWMESL
jgi:hypothetical protein